MVTKLNERALSILKDEEKLAITLKYGHSKSSWEAGEIVGKAHYKFLEIEARAKKFLQMFTEHIEVYDEIIPDYLKIDKRVISYLKHTIEDRMTIKEAVNEIDDHEFDQAPKRSNLIMEAIEKLHKSNSAIDKNIVILVMDFDRWNNFRILPRDIQEPSAFKRRNKNYDLRNLKNLVSINPFSVDKIKELYGASDLAEKILLMPVFSKFIKKESSILRIRREDSIVEKLSTVGYFLFTREERAKEFLDLIFSYSLITKDKSCTDGQKFWPKFRLTVKHSLNYHMVKKRIPSRKFLESALKDIDHNILNPPDSFLKKPRKKRKRLRKKEKISS